MLNSLWSKYKKSEFSRNVSSLVLGTGIAQLLPFLATPLLTRIYDEKEFAYYTSFFALATIFSVGAGGKYFMAIVLPKRHAEAMRVLTLSNYVSIAYSVLLLALILAFFYQDFIPIEEYTYFVPLYVLFFGLWSGQTYLSIREKTFKDNARAKVLQSGFYIISALGYGFFGFTLYGLIFAKISGLIASWFFLFMKSTVKIAAVPIAKIKEVAKKYIDYPKYGVAPSFLNTLSAQALILVLTRYYPIDELGRYGLTFMVLTAPLGLIGTSFRDVFYQRVATLFTDRKYDESLNFFKKSALTLFALGVPICITLLLFGEEIFSFIFGKTWSRSGLFASIMAVGYLAKLVASPLSAIFNAANKLKIASIWQVGYFITTFSVLGLGAIYFKLEIETLLLVYVIHEVVLYVLYFLLEYSTLIKMKNRRAH